jgi:predicted extracellular nuclease
MKTLLQRKSIGVVLIFLSAQLIAQTHNVVHEFSAAFYNAENLFDNEDDPETNDEDFLPESEKEWTEVRYQKKLKDVARVIASMPGKHLPDLVGLSEVENRTVLLDLVKQADLFAAGYMIVHKDSPDRRGIDVALLYKPDRFEVLYQDYFTIPLVTNGKPTRDVLYVKGLVSEADTLHVFINHWPSRFGGKEKSAPNRNAVAAMVRYRVDSLLQNQPDCKILLMGDFNDNPDDESIVDILGGASMPDQTDKPLFNLYAAAWSRGEGTFNYRGDWGMLDQILISWSLKDATRGLSVKPDAAGILRKPWMIYTNEKGVE